MQIYSLLLVVIHKMGQLRALHAMLVHILQKVVQLLSSQNYAQEEHMCNQRTEGTTSNNTKTFCIGPVLILMVVRQDGSYSPDNTDVLNTLKVQLLMILNLVV